MQYKLCFDQCLDCGSNNVTSSPFPFTIDKTRIIDLPHIYCKDCGTYIISTEFTDPVARVLALLDICPKEITMEQIRAADRFGWIKF